MVIHCDSSYSDEIAGIGVVVMDYSTMLYRYSKKIKCKSSQIAEEEAIDFAIEIAKKHGIRVIKNDCKNAVNKRREWAGEVGWIPRKRLRIANSIAWLARQEIDIEDEYLLADGVSVVKNSYPPGSYLVDDQVVIRKNGLLICTCMAKNRNGHGMKKEKFFTCRHIVAVKKKIGEITNGGENV